MRKQIDVDVQKTQRLGADVSARYHKVKHVWTVNSAQKSTSALQHFPGLKISISEYAALPSPLFSLQGCPFVSTLSRSIFHYTGLEYCIVHYCSDPLPEPERAQIGFLLSFSRHGSSIMKETGTVQDSNTAEATRTTTGGTQWKEHECPVHFESGGNLSLRFLLTSANKAPFYLRVLIYLIKACRSVWSSSTQVALHWAPHIEFYTSKSITHCWGWNMSRGNTLAKETSRPTTFKSSNLIF